MRRLACRKLLYRNPLHTSTVVTGVVWSLREALQAFSWNKEMDLDSLEVLVEINGDAIHVLWCRLHTYIIQALRNTTGPESYFCSALVLQSLDSLVLYLRCLHVFALDVTTRISRQYVFSLASTVFRPTQRVTSFLHVCCSVHDILSLTFTFHSFDIGPLYISLNIT
jgi:hypothetical protein